MTWSLHTFIKKPFSEHTDHSIMAGASRELLEASKFAFSYTGGFKLQDLKIEAYSSFLAHFSAFPS